MKDIYEVEALRVAAPLLAEDEEAGNPPMTTSRRRTIRLRRSPSELGILR